MEYNEIKVLHEMLVEIDIPHTFEQMFGGYQIRLNANVDAVEHDGSYGRNQDLIEIMGGLTKEENEDESVLGYLTAKEVFKRFKYCYENKTSVYKKEN